MNDPLGQDEQGECHEEPDLRLQVLQERYPAAAESPSLERGQDEERQPGDQGDRDDAPVDEIERRARQARSQEELVQRPAQDERELFGIGRFGVIARRASPACRSTISRHGFHLSTVSS